MILTRDELGEWLRKKVTPAFLFNEESMATIFVDILSWNDEEPRDITASDLDDFEQKVCVELDRMLTSIEHDIQGKSVAKEN